MCKSKLLAAVLLAGVVGCGGSIREESVTPPSITPKEAIKSALEPVAKAARSAAKSAP